VASRRFNGQKIVASKKRKAKDGKANGSQRKVIVFASLLAVMTVTSALLLALAPAPLTPGAVSSLFAVDSPDSLDTLFRTTQPVQAGRWTHIYIHHSLTPGGNAASLGESAGGLADHFVIGNGDGCDDGEVQIAQRWNHQRGAGRVQGLTSISDSCISICIIGDFDRTLPTDAQILHLTQLVQALQSRCQIPARNVYVLPGDTSPAGIGRYFPATKLRDRLLP
jgi:hypothetical protein